MGRLIRQIFLSAAPCLLLPALSGAQTLQNSGSGELNTLSLDLTQATITLNRLPLIDVARRWGLSVEAYSGQPRGSHGKYRWRQAIALGVENLSTWAHELLHAADDRLGNLTERGQHWRSETVAELGGAVLLTTLGIKQEADVGGCWEYVSAYAKDAQIEPVTACQRVLKRICDAVALVLDTAEKLLTVEPVPSA